MAECWWGGLGPQSPHRRCIPRPHYCPWSRPGRPQLQKINNKLCKITSMPHARKENQENSSHLPEQVGNTPSNRPERRHVSGAMGNESGLKPALQVGLTVFPAFTVTPLGHPEDPLAMAGHEHVMTRVVVVLALVVVVVVRTVVGTLIVVALRPPWESTCCPETFTSEQKKNRLLPPSPPPVPRFHFTLTSNTQTQTESTARMFILQRNQRIMEALSRPLFLRKGFSTDLRPWWCDHARWTRNGWHKYRCAFVARVLLVD